MYKLIYTPQARRDLNEIRKYISRSSGNASTGLDFTKKLRAKCRELASIEGVIGITRPDLGLDLRSHPFGRYMIFFRYNNKNFEIVSIIEGHRDIANIFDEE